MGAVGAGAVGAGLSGLAGKVHNHNGNDKNVDSANNSGGMTSPAGKSSAIQNVGKAGLGVGKTVAKVAVATGTLGKMAVSGNLEGGSMSKEMEGFQKQSQNIGNGIGQGAKTTYDTIDNSEFVNDTRQYFEKRKANSEGVIPRNRDSNNNNNNK